MQINGILIKAVIAQSGLKCWQVAKQLNISDSYLSFILTGRRKANAIFLSRLGKLLKVDPRLFLKESTVLMPSSKSNGPVKSRPTSHKKKGKK